MTSGFCCPRKDFRRDGSAASHIHPSEGSNGCLVEFKSESELMRDVFTSGPDRNSKMDSGHRPARFKERLLQGSSFFRQIIVQQQGKTIDTVCVLLIGRSGFLRCILTHRLIREMKGGHGE